MIAGAAGYDEMNNALRTLDVPFQVSVKDLRSQVSFLFFKSNVEACHKNTIFFSQVVREACITIAYLSQQLHHKADRLLEALLQPIINLIPNSAKVMSTSGITCVRFVIQHTYSAR